MHRDLWSGFLQMSTWVEGGLAEAMGDSGSGSPHPLNITTHSEVMKVTRLGGRRREKYLSIKGLISAWETEG